MTKRLFVFDWNGTILSDTVPSWKAGNVALEFYGVKPIPLQLHRETFCFPIVPFYEIHGVSEKEVMERREEGNEAFQAAYSEFAKNARTRTGARVLLDHLNDQGAECIILSNYLTTRIQEHLDRLKIGHYFSHVSGYDCDGTTILKSTTKTLRLRSYMEEQGYASDHVVIIGDTMEEPEIARELDITSVGITGGYITERRLREARPDYIVDRLDAIKTLGLL
jgi:phosphoglycolate phosphatase